MAVISRHINILLLIVLLAGIAVTASSARADNTVPNPKYLAWCKYKPGSSETFEADVQSQGQRFHIQTVQTLISVGDDDVVVETVSTGTVKGQKPNHSTKRETFKAKAAPDELKQSGEKEIQAIGKTFKCKVFDSPAKPAAGSGGAKADPPSLAGTIYLSDDVPGGLVRLDAVGTDGNVQTFILTGMDVK